jgi:hypothetical protein
VRLAGVALSDGEKVAGRSEKQSLPKNYRDGGVLVSFLNNPSPNSASFFGQ